MKNTDLLCSLLTTNFDCVNLKKNESSIVPMIFFEHLECGRTFQENSASFTSPSYYSSTPSAEPESCEWRITATHGEKIVLNITDLVLLN